jgi:hypothetical protein
MLSTAVQHHKQTQQKAPTSTWMVSPYAQHVNMQLSKNSIISILYFNIDFKLLFNT